MQLRSKLTIALFSTVLLAVAQTPAPTLYRIVHNTVKPDRIAEYIDIQKAISEGSKKGGATVRTVWRGAAGNTNEFYSVAPLSAYGDLDGESAYAKAVPQQQRDALGARLAQCVLSTRVTYERVLTDASIIKPNSPLPKYIRMVRARVRLGSEEEYVALLKNELVPAYKKIDVPGFRVRRIEYGGPRNEITVTMPMEKMGELDDQALIVKALGADGTKKFTAKVDAIGTLREYLIWRLVPEASFTTQ